MSTPATSTALASAPVRRPVPTGWSGTRAVIEHFAILNLRAARRSASAWFLAPLMFLASLGLGLGELVDSRSGGIGGVPYLRYVAPAIVITHAMGMATEAGTWPVMNHFTWSKTYFAVINSPVAPMQILIGYTAVVTAVLVAVVSIFAGVAALFGAFGSWWAVACVPIAVLTGIAFLMPLLAYVATIGREGEQFNIIFRFVITPMMLFSGTFYPISELPVFLQALAWVTPLWHGTELSRAIALNGPHAIANAMGLAHLLVLLAYAAVGAFAASITYRRRLIT